MDGPKDVHGSLPSDVRYLMSNKNCDRRHIVGHDNAFAIVKPNGGVVTWGNAYWGALGVTVREAIASDVREVTASRGAFAAVKADGSVVTWGESEFGGESSAVQEALASDVLQVVSTDRAFAALKANGSVGGRLRHRLPLITADHGRSWLTTADRGRS